jgi:hypothetical protein
VDYIAENGKKLTDSDFDRMAQEYEEGTWAEPLGKVVMGRPRLSDEDAKVISFKLPVSRIDAIDKLAKRSGETRSEFLRDLVDRALVEGFAS